ncbi:MAG: 2'-5' RNA ligase family protein [Treponemataceae bacterium]|nr:2'-5' RNA ligase family protein [Treponemataceae bacterium]
MKQSLPYDTYAVSLLFDKSASAAIADAVQALARETGNDRLTVPAVPPHITLGMFHAGADAADALAAAFSRFAQEAGRAWDVAFRGVGSFGDKVLFLAPDMAASSSARLLELNERLHDLLLPSFAPGANRDYLPQHWTAHVTLAAGLTPAQHEKGRAAVSAHVDGGNPLIVLPTSARVAAVTLARCHPYEEVARVSLPSDPLSPERRRANMAAIHSTGGRLETQLRSQLFRFGFRFRKNDRRLAGSPDIVFPHCRAVVFVNGCFWHAHGWKSADSAIVTPVRDEPIFYVRRCDKFRMPTTNTAFWQAKFERNRARDKRDIAALLEQGWRVGVLWECTIMGKHRAQNIRAAAEKISLWLEEGQDEPFKEF